MPMLLVPTLLWLGDESNLYVTACQIRQKEWCVLRKFQYKGSEPWIGRCARRKFMSFSPTLLRGA